MARLITPNDMGQDVTVGIRGGREVKGVITNVNEDVLMLEWTSSGAKRYHIARVKHEEVSDVTFNYTKAWVDEIAPVPIPRKGGTEFLKTYSQSDEGAGESHKAGTP